MLGTPAWLKIMVPVKTPKLSGPPGVRSSATGRRVQWTMSLLTAWAQVMLPHTLPLGLY